MGYEGCLGALVNVLVFFHNNIGESLVCMLKYYTGCMYKAKMASDRVIRKSYPCYITVNGNTTIVMSDH